MPSDIESSGSQISRVAERNAANSQSRRERRNVRERQARARNGGDEAATRLACEYDTILLPEACPYCIQPMLVRPFGYVRIARTCL
jgi:hypothetical protein